MSGANRGLRSRAVTHQMTFSLLPQARGPRRARGWLGGVEVRAQRSGARNVYKTGASDKRRSRPGFCRK